MNQAERIISRITGKYVMHKYMKLKAGSFHLFFAGIILFALFIRLYGLCRGWTYDEIWGLTSWMKCSDWTILNMLDYQNNHPLNTVFMKYANMFFGINCFAIRFHDFLAGVLLVPAVYMLAVVWTRNKYVALLSSVFAAAHGGLIYYSQVARGYSLETFLVTVFCLLTVLWIRNADKLSRAKRCAIALGMVISMIAACNTLCTAILFIAPVMFYHLYFLIIKYFSNKETLRRKTAKLIQGNPELIAAWAIITSFAVLLYIVNYHKFASAVPAAGGAAVNSFSTFIIFLKTLFAKLIPYWILIPGIFAILKPRFRTVIILLLMLCLAAFSSAFFAKGGPARAYLPLVPFFCISGGCGFYVILKLFLKNQYSRIIKNTVLLAICATCALTAGSNADKWAEPDCKRDFKTIAQIPANCLVAYPACYTLPLAFNNKPAVYKDNFSRINNCSDGSRLLTSGTSNGQISVLNDYQGEENISLGIDGRRIELDQLELFEYSLIKISKNVNIKGKAVLVVIPFNSMKITNAAINYLKDRHKGKWLMLNCWLYVPFIMKSDNFSAVVLVNNDLCIPAEELLDIEQKSHMQIKFFAVAAPPDNYNQQPASGSR